MIAVRSSIRSGSRSALRIVDVMIHLYNRPSNILPFDLNEQFFLLTGHQFIEEIGETMPGVVIFEKDLVSRPS